jgi:hypothetical protein
VTSWTGNGGLQGYTITRKVVLALQEEKNNRRYEKETTVIIHAPSGCYLFQADAKQDRDQAKYVFTAEGADWESWLYISAEENDPRAEALGITIDHDNWRSEFAFRQKFGDVYNAKYPLDDSGKVQTPWSEELVGILAHLILIDKSYFGNSSRMMLPDSFDFRPPNIPKQFHHYFDHLLTGKPQL